MARPAELQPPSHLTAAQKRRFREIAAGTRQLRTSDAPALAGFVIAESLLIEAAKKRRALPESLISRGDRGGETIGILVRIQLKALETMQSYIAMLGLSPRARASLPYGGNDPWPGVPRLDELDELLRRDANPKAPAEDEPLTPSPQ